MFSVKSMSINSVQFSHSVLNIHWKDWCWSWNSNTLATWCEELTHWKRPWCWERLKVGREGDDRGWDGWMASPTQWTWVWVSSASWWWTGRPTEWLNWTELIDIDFTENIQKVLKVSARKLWWTIAVIGRFSLDGLLYLKVVNREYTACAYGLPLTTL